MTIGRSLLVWTMGKHSYDLCLGSLASLAPHLVFPWKDRYEEFYLIPSDYFPLLQEQGFVEDLCYIECRWFRGLILASFSIFNHKMREDRLFTCRQYSGPAAAERDSQCHDGEGEERLSSSQIHSFSVVLSSSLVSFDCMTNLCLFKNPARPIRVFLFGHFELLRATALPMGPIRLLFQPRQNLFCVVRTLLLNNSNLTAEE
jgi:hypothetical protein